MKIKYKGIIVGLGLLLSATSAMAFETKAKYALLMDADTGYVMLNKDADVAMPPASMSKLMTAYLIFEQIKSGKLTWDTEFTVSENAWRTGGVKSGSSTMFLKPNQKVKIKDLIRGIIIQSGNDACIVAAENIAGSEEVFADLMTRKAKELGLKNSGFKNATGLPQDGHEMSSFDLARLAQALIRDFPEYYPIYSEKEFKYNGIKQGNRNPLLYEVAGADGLKTGHTQASGFGLTGSVKTMDGRRLIMVLNGLKTMAERREESKRVIGWGAGSFENITMYHTGDVVDNLSVWLGTQKTVPATVNRDLTVTVPRGLQPDVRAEIHYEQPVSAPISKGQKLGTIIVRGPDNQAQTADLVAAESIEKVGYFGKLKAVVLSWFGK
ncbi:MAG: D-alanyl-D-alanine carboxypeptidase [Alphaproteobacteria bacterium]|nr:D-alanyl-D-alanine carboxypeptidase [Alphaproteobacteria bacterium]